MYFGWFGIGVLSVGFWLFSGYMYSHSVIAYEICDSTDIYINEKEKFHEYSTLINHDNAETCFYGNGRLDENFDLI